MKLIKSNHQTGQTYKWKVHLLQHRTELSTYIIPKKNNTTQQKDTKQLDIEQEWNNVKNIMKNAEKKTLGAQNDW